MSFRSKAKKPAVTLALLSKRKITPCPGPLSRRTLPTALVPAAFRWPADYALWLLRGYPTSTVEVTHFTVVP